MYYTSGSRRRARPSRRLGNMAPPDDSTTPMRVLDSGFSPLIGGGGGGSIDSIVAAAEAAFPFTYDSTGNNGNGSYTWNDNSFGNQSINAIDASQQFPSGGFLPGGVTTTIAQAPAGVTVAPAPTDTLIPTWWWWAGGIAALGLVLTRPKR